MSLTKKTEQQCNILKKNISPEVSESLILETKIKLSWLVMNSYIKQTVGPLYIS